jgi:NADPH-dependent ferric siderophore reductase
MGETPRVRRAPPPFRRVTVRRVEGLSPRLVRVTLAGPELSGWSADEPAASVRLLLPTPGDDQLVLPRWERNEFLLPDGRRATIRTLTPRRFDPAVSELDVDIVLHGRGVVADWATAVVPGDEAAVSGPGRGYTIDPAAPGYLLAGDETAIPAVSQLLEHLPAEAAVEVYLEVAVPSARVPMPAGSRAIVHWLDAAPRAAPGDALVAAIGEVDIMTGTQLWAAGEAAAMQRIRRHLFDERGWPRTAAVVRGYWKHGRAGGDAGT